MIRETVIDGELALDPAAIPTWQNRAAELAALGWKARDAEWLALVALHSGVFLRSQWCRYFDYANREAARVLVRQLIDKKLAIETAPALFPGGARAVLLTGKPIYRALDIEDVRHRRGKHASPQLVMRRLLSLDYIIERPTLGWLATETDKVYRFEVLGIDRRVLPVRNYGEPYGPRYFDLKLPVAVDAQTATFVYVNPKQSTDSELRAWGVDHAPLWAALRARAFTVHVVAVGLGADAARQAAPVLERWTKNGAGQVVPSLTTRTPAEASRARPSQADPEIREEIDRLEMALKTATHFLLEAGGLSRAMASLDELRALPKGTPATTPTKVKVEEEIDRLETAIKAGNRMIVLEAGWSGFINARLDELRALPESPMTARAAIDRFSTWNTTRLVSPEAAS